LKIEYENLGNLEKKTEKYSKNPNTQPFEKPKNPPKNPILPALGKNTSEKKP
jgi:hypothetical protein